SAALDGFWRGIGLSGSDTEMSLMGYLTAGQQRESRMAAGGPGAAGIRFEGAVLNGLRSAEERRAGCSVRVGGRDDGEVYGRVGRYDAVLRAHCAFEIRSDTGEALGSETDAAAAGPPDGE
ncbi:MAG: hypothetical protein ABJC09_06350, partial [Terriglobia bacterium]